MSDLSRLMEMNRDEILARVRALMSERFEVDPARVNLETRLVEDLDLDSIDAIDMAVELQGWTGVPLAEEALRAVRTVDDVISMIEAHLAKIAATNAGAEQSADAAAGRTETSGATAGSAATGAAGGAATAGATGNSVTGAGGNSAAGATAAGNSTAGATGAARDSGSDSDATSAGSGPGADSVTG